MKVKNKAKKIVAFVVAAIITLGGFGYSSTPNTPLVGTTEVYAHWADQYMQKLQSQGILKGDTDGSMNPNRNITRAEFIAMINRAFGYTGVSAKNPFKDMKGTEWFADDILIAYNNNYFSGVEKGVSGARSNLTREQAVALMSRILKLEEVPGENSQFSDSKTFRRWSTGAINAVANKKIISGYKDNTFRPLNGITRGEAASMFSNAIGELISVPSNRSLGQVNGNVTISSSGVTLSNTVIAGDLYITEGVGTGYIELQNVNILGEMVVAGAGQSNAGESSIYLNDSNVSKLTIDGPADKMVSLIIDGNSTVKDTIVKSDATLEENTPGSAGFQNVLYEGPEDSELHILGNFNTVKVKGPKNNLFVDSGHVENVIMDEEATDSTLRVFEGAYVSKIDCDVNVKITGTGDIGYLNINVNGVSCEQFPDEIYIKPGLTAIIGGKEYTNQTAQELTSSPRILAGYPRVEGITAAKADSLFKTNKEGTIYWGITLADRDNLSSNELVKQTKTERVIKMGKAKVSQAQDEITQAISGLKTGTEYTLHSILVDEKDEESSVKRTTFTTFDNTKPTFVSGYPRLGGTTNSSGEIAVITSKDAKIYWAAYPKGRLAPTATELKAQGLTGNVDKGTTNTKKNIEKIFDVDGLDELTAYDVYMVAIDDEENESKVAKISFTTNDTTAPQFLSGYPSQGTIADKSVAVNYAINEDATVYYVVINKGDRYLPSDRDKELVFGCEEDKKAVMSGANSVKNGKGTAKAEKEGKVTISGLQPETPYDVFMMAVDKYNNMSDIKKFSIKTGDKVPPTAEMGFEDEIDGQPSIKSNIYIYFSEEVLSQYTLKELTVEDLQDVLKLYDRTALPEKEVAIDFNHVTVENSAESGTIRTEITFKPESVEWKEGNKYQFVLTKIQDTSNNKMPNNTRLDEFITRTPLITFTEVNATEAGSMVMDMAFKLTIPGDANMEEGTLYDFIFSCDHAVKFKLYERDENGDLIPVDPQDKEFVISKAGQGTTYYSTYPIQGRTFDYFENLKGQLEPDGDGKIPDTVKYYEVDITSIDGVTSGWNTTIDFGVSLYSGSKNNLGIIANNAASNLERGLKQAVDNGALQMNYPKNFSMKASFVETDYPLFAEGYPKFVDVSDQSVTVKIKTTKPCTLYYIYAYANTIGSRIGDDEVGSTGIRGFETTITDTQILNNNVKPQFGGSDTFTVDSANVEYEFTINNLPSNQDFDMLFLLKGPSPAVGPVIWGDFITNPPAGPKVNFVTAIDNTTATINVEVNKTMRLTWALYPMPSMTMSQAEVDEFVKTISAEDIKGGKTIYYNYNYNGNHTGEILSKSDGTTNFTLKKGQDLATETIKITGLDKNIKYIFFAYATLPADGTTGDYINGTDFYTNANRDGEDSMLVVANILRKDADAPKVECATNIKYKPKDDIPASDTDYNDTGDIIEDVTGYYGIVGLVFNETVYYVDNDTGNTKKFDKEAFDNNRLESGSFDFEPVGSSTDFRFRFSGVTPGEFVFSTVDLVDVSGNVAGKLRLTFTVTTEEVVIVDPVTGDERIEEQVVKAEWVPSYFKD